MWIQARVHDDRDKVVPLATSAHGPVQGLVSGRAKRITAALARSTGDSASPLERRQAVRFAVVMLPLFLLMGIAPVLIALTSWWLFPLVVPLGAAQAWFGIAISNRWHARRLARAIVNEGICGSCAHELRGLPSHEDGCTLCPECGAAWRLDPAKPPAPLP